MQPTEAHMILLQKKEITMKLVNNKNSFDLVNKVVPFYYAVTDKT